MNAMASISTMQALDVWTDLMEARSGDAAYGGDVAEIYLYRLTPFDPMLLSRPRNDPALRPTYAIANAALHDLCRTFETRTASVVSFEDGSDIGALLAPEHETHRVHLRVSPAQEPGRP